VGLSKKIARSVADSDGKRGNDPYLPCLYCDGKAKRAIISCKVKVTKTYHLRRKETPQKKQRLQSVFFMNRHEGQLSG
jgi:hypothetical protein